jgi:capsular exopolysaccharide synthesis family protein
MDLKAYITPLLRYWWLLLAAALVAGITSFIILSQQPPVYQTRTTLIVGRAVFEANPASDDLWLAQQLANFYADIGMRGEVQTQTMETLGLNWLPEYYVRPMQNSQLLEIVVTDTNALRAQAVANELANQLIRRSPTSSDQGQQHQAFVNEQIQYLEGKIRETVEEIDKAERQLTDLNSARQIADTQAEISALQTKLAQLQTNYSGLISNTEAGAANSLTVIEPAPLPTTPVSSNRMITVLAAALIALVIAASAAYLLEFLDDTFKSADEITERLHLPVLANIPTFSTTAPGARPAEKTGLFKRTIFNLNRRAEKTYKHSRPAEESSIESYGNLSGLVGKKNGKEDAHSNNGRFLYSAAYERSTIAEEFRLLRINMDFAGVDKPLKSIFVTSPDPNEGKTSVATNLAIVTAQSGKKVILVDTDFRKPSVDMHFSISNECGLSDLFRESHDVTQITQRWQDSNLWIIPTGLTPPNPVDILSSNRMGQILEELCQISDVVIVDGPPMLFPDSLSLAAKMDGVLIVLRHAYSRRNNTIARVKQLTSVGARIIGVALNRTPDRQYKYYSSYYRSHYTQKPEDEAVETKRERV